MSDERKNNGFKDNNSYDPRAFSRAGVCPPARSNDRSMCTKPKPPPQYTFENPPPRHQYSPEPVPLAGPGFYVVPYSMNAKEMFDTLFEDIPNSALLKFSDLNPDLDGFIKAGTLIILSDLRVS
ncbi:hypothetical protein PS874_04849 [Pseudomonas fluorescens]|nr:hypothetical protein PS874_04849 [Pseudomonas fluorescens]